MKKISKKKLVKFRDNSEISGKFHALRNGGAFVEPDCATHFSKDKGKASSDIFIHPRNQNGAWPGDQVRVEIFPSQSIITMPKKSTTSKPHHAREGRIIEIVERKLKEIPASLIKRQGQTLFCKPLDERIRANFKITLEEIGSIQALTSESILLVAPDKYLGNDLWNARLLNVYGSADNILVQEELVKLNHNVPVQFSDAALNEVKKLPYGPTPNDLSEREDLRAIPFVTVDGEDARDFDDAIHVERQGSGWLLRVAIADVSHYVRPRGATNATPALDAEALERGNSWYFPRSVEPMLPPELSNGLCSLKPGEDRLALLVEIPFNEDAKPGNPRFAPIIMRSRARLTYTEVNAAITEQDQSARNTLLEYAPESNLTGMLENAFTLYKCLRKQRLARGSLDFDLPEAHYSFDANGRISAVGIAERTDAHRLIEEFMIVANELVSRWLEAKDLPFLYRVHPKPDPEKLDSLFATLASMPLDNLSILLKSAAKEPGPEALREILRMSQGEAQEYVLNRLCLRAMPQARYQPENIGHFGLASASYTHFTSPIRRYADLLTHRAVKLALGFDAGIVPAGAKLFQIGDRLNRREREALECEREMSRRLSCLALRGHEGEDFDCIISGITEFGIFVELDKIPVEGLIRINDLPRDNYIFNPASLTLSGQSYGHLYRLGQRLRARLTTVDSNRLEINFTLADKGKKQKQSRRIKQNQVQNSAAKKPKRQHKSGNGWHGLKVKAAQFSKKPKHKSAKRKQGHQN